MEFDDNIVGGENTFADMHEIAQRMRSERPDYFHTLTRVPVVGQTVHYDRDFPVHLRTKRPIFQLNDRDDLVCIPLRLSC